MKKKNFMITLQKLLLNAGLLTLVFQGAGAAPSDKDTLRIGISAEFETLNPMIAEQAASKYMLYLAWRPLVVLSLDSKWIPLMITKIPTIENKMVVKKGTGLDVTMEILPEAQWGDGTPVTCKDVEFAWRVGKHPNTSLPSKENYENVASITWDPKTPKKCVTSFTKANFDYFANFINPLPEHLEGPVFEKFKDKPQGYDHNTLYTKNPTNPGLYNGPFVISDVKLGSHVMFGANPKFGGKKASINKILFKLIPNANTLTTNLQAGDIDMIVPPAGLGFDQALAFEKRIKSEKLPYKIEFAEGVVYAHIDINLDVPALADPVVRKALALSMNKKQMVASFFENRAKEAIHFLPHTDPWYTDKIPKYEYNRREAIKTLEAAGWKVGPKGVRSKDGQTLSFTIIGASGNKIIENIETFLQAQWKAIGVDLRIKNEPARVFFGETTRRRKFDMALFSWTSLPENSPRTILHSKEIPSEANSWTGQNFMGYKNPEVDKLIDAIEQEFNAKKRIELGRKIVEYYVNDLPVLPIYFRPNTAVIPIDMKGYRPSGHMHYESLYAENWSRK